MMFHRALGVLFIGASLAGPGQAPQTPAPAVFGVQIDNVFVDAFVTSRREPVKGLTAADFELKDNGVTQSLELVSTEALPLLAILVFDGSGSLAGERLLALRAASRAFLAALRPQDEVSLFTFANTTRWQTRPTTDKAEVLRALDRLQTGGATSAIDALFAALTLPQTGSRTLVVLFTDGEDNQSWLDWREIVQVAERSNALIHVVGLRRSEDSGPEAPTFDLTGRMLPVTGGREFEWIHTWGLRQAAEATGGRYWEAESPARLQAAFAAITEAMAQRYILSYEPQGVRRSGWHEIELRLREGKGEVHARRGYWIAER
jgi:VWFA-related protein